MSGRSESALRPDTPVIVSGASTASPDIAGLSRRLSWNRSQDGERPLMPSPRPQDETYPSPLSHAIDYDNPFEDDRSVPDPYSYPPVSQISLVNFSEGHNGRAYDEQSFTASHPLTWNPDSEDDAEQGRSVPNRRRYTGASPLPSGSLSGNALKAVKRSIRRISVRVVDLASSGTQHVRLNDETSETRSSQVHGESAPTLSGTPLRGYTLGIFGPYSSMRRSMFDFLQFQWTEPIILCLIFVHTIVLILQSSKPICPVTTNNPCPRPNGYFNQWEDYALFALFILYSLESVARIVVSGLFIDPDQKWRVAIRNNIRQLISEMSPWRQHHQFPVEKSLNQNTQAYPPPGRGSTRLEAPFQLAIEKQRSLSRQGRPYLRHSWNRVDFVSIVCFWVTFILAITRVEATDSRHIYIFRALSVLRVSRLLSMTSGTATTMQSLKRAAPLLVRVAMFVLFAMILFSIIGVQSFKGSFRRTCQSAGAQTNPQQPQFCGGFIDPTTLNVTGYVNNGKPTVYSKGYVCSLGQTCNSTDQNPNGNLQSFDNIIYASFQVLIIAGVNTWSGVMYDMMDAEFFVSALYFISGVIILNFWLLNLFVAVITNTFSAIREETKKSAFGAKNLIPTFDEHDDGWPIASATNTPVGNSLLQFYEYTSYVWTLLALVSLGFQASRTSTSSPSYIKLLNAVELYITLAFDVEITWRVLGHFPDWRLFFRSKQNALDLFLALSSSIIQIPVIHYTRVYPWLTIFQLGRFYRVILAVPGMRPLLFQLFGNPSGLINMTLFLLLTNLIGGLIAVQLFRGDVPPSQQEMSFYQILNAFLAMYQIFSSENWTAPAYSVATAEVGFKQAVISLLFFSAWFVFANSIMLQMFIAVINENFEIVEAEKRAEQVRTFVKKAAPVSAGITWMERLNPYRYLKGNPKLIAVDTLPSRLVLPMPKTLVQTNRGNRGVGQTQMPTVEQYLDDAARHRRGIAGYLERLFELNAYKDGIEMTNDRHVRRPSLPVQTLVDEDERHLDILTALNADHAIEGTSDTAAEDLAIMKEFIALHPTYDKTFWVFSQRNPIRRACQLMVAPSNGDRVFGQSPNFWAQLGFQLFLLLSVLGGIVVSSVANPIYRQQYISSHPGIRLPWYEVAQAVFALVLVIEFIIKVIADGLMFTPNAYIFNIWNVVDFMMLAAVLGGVVPTLVSSGSIGRFGRALRAFPALRLITIFGFMRSTFHSVIFAGAERILSAAVLALLYMIPYAVWGLNMFSGLLFACNDTNSGGKGSCTGEYVANLGFLAPKVWGNPQTSTRWSFDNFRSSLLILFEIVSLEGWIDVLAASMQITGLDQQPSQDASQANAIFFVAYNLMGAVVILTLFVSIIIVNFSSRSGMALLTTEQRQWIDLQKLLKRQRPSRRPKSLPDRPWRRWCYDRAVHKHGWWSRGMSGVYWLHIINLTTQTFYEQMSQSNTQDIIFLLLTLVYFVDICVRLIGLGRSFTANGWNIFDIFVVLGTFTTTLAIVGGSKGFAVQQLQKLFLVSMAFKLVQKLNALNQLFKTSVASLRAIIQLFLLWIVLFVFFGMVNVEVFALTRWFTWETHNQNYTTLPKALIMLTFQTTGEGWNQYMHDYATQYPYCTNPTPEKPYSDCGSRGWAYTLFITWNVLSMYIFVNMFTGVVVENFSYVFQLTGPASITREEMRAFKMVWTEFDPARRGYIRREDLGKFFPRLSGVFEVRIYPVEASYKKLLARARQLSSPDETDPRFPELDFSIADLNRVLSTIDYAQTRRRRAAYNRLYQEALAIANPERGISFNDMLILLAHHKIIDDENALKVDELLRRQATTEYVTDRLDLDRVRSLLKMICQRKKYLDKKRQLLQADAGVPSILVDSAIDGHPSTPPPLSTRDITLASRNSLYLGNTPTRSSISPLSRLEDTILRSPTAPRRTSDISTVDIGSSSRSVSRDPSPVRDSGLMEDPQHVLQSLNSSVWGEMMLDESADNE